MFLTVHAAAGTIIGETSPNVLIAFVLGFISHFSLDIIPHGDTRLIKEKFKFSRDEINLLKKLTLADVLVMSVILALLYVTGHVTDILSVMFGIAGALLPDFIQGIYVLTEAPLLKKYFSLHWNIHYVLKGLTVSFETGLIIQIFFLLTFLSLIVYF